METFMVKVVGTALVVLLLPFLLAAYAAHRILWTMKHPPVKKGRPAS